MSKLNEHAEIVDGPDDSGGSYDAKKMIPPLPGQYPPPPTHHPYLYPPGIPGHGPLGYQPQPAQRSLSPLLIISGLFGLAGIGAFIAAILLLFARGFSSPGTYNPDHSALAIIATQEVSLAGESAEQDAASGGASASADGNEPNTPIPTTTPEPTDTIELLYVEPTDIPAPTSTPLPPAPPTSTPLPPPTSTPLPPAPPTFPSQDVSSILQSPGGRFGAIVYDETDQQVLYEYNADTTFYAASLIKLSIAFTVYRMAWQGSLDLNDRLTMHEFDIVPGTGFIQHDGAGSTYTLEDLCRRMIIDSDNTASNMVLDYIGYDTVNEVMYQIEANQTIVERRFFDEAARLAGRDIRTSPRDMLTFLRVLQSDPRAQPLLDAMAANTDDAKIPALLPSNAFIMNKTGVLPAPDGLEHDIAIVRTPQGRSYIIVIMSTGLSNNQAAIDAIARASHQVFDYEQEIGR